MTNENSPQPRLCYTIWFTQRVGSTWLGDMLSNAGTFGRPQEHLNFPNKNAVFDHFQTKDAAKIRRKLWRHGSTPNGVFGLECGFSQPAFTDILESVFPDPSGALGPIDRWHNAFPNHHHIYLSRRNKVRLAVSWWRAIKSGEWHKISGNEGPPADLTNAYDFDAIQHLMNEAVLREAGISEMLSAASITPLRIDYEDLVSDPQIQLDRIADFLGLDRVEPLKSTHQIVADKTSEAWVQRFRSDLQKDWTNRGW